MVASAGAGGGSFNHRFASPGQAGNSVLSIFRPVDLPPFTDDGLLVKAQAASVVPRIFYTFSSTEYWARAGSLTHTNETGTADVPFASTSRLYFLTGTPHASGGLPPTPQQTRYASELRRPEMGAACAAHRSRQVGDERDEPPPSRYPTIAQRQLVPRDAVRFPKIPSCRLPATCPACGGWTTAPTTPDESDHEGAAVTRRSIPVLVPQVNADGNDVGGSRCPKWPSRSGRTRDGMCRRIS